MSQSICQHCHKENPDGFMMVDVDQEPDGSYISALCCEHCGRLICLEDGSDASKHENVLPPEDQFEIYKPAPEIYDEDDGSIFKD